MIELSIAKKVNMETNFQIQIQTCRTARKGQTENYFKQYSLQLIIIFLSKHSSMLPKLDQTIDNHI